MDSGKKKFDPRSIDEKAILGYCRQERDDTTGLPCNECIPEAGDTAEEIAGSSEARSLPPGKSTLTGRPS